MAEKEKSSSKVSVGPSVVLGLVGAVVVLLLLAAGVWGVGKIISKVREAREESEEEETVAEEEEEVEEGAEEEEAEEEAEAETEAEEEEAVAEEGEEEVAEEEREEGEVGEAAVTEEVEEEEAEEEETEGTIEEEEVAEEEEGDGISGIWVANDYKSGDINGGSYTVVWGDTLWEIAEGRYGSGFEWGKIRDANLDQIGFLPNGSQALIIPGQVLTLP